MDKPAFAQTIVRYIGGEEYSDSYQGLSRREYFAAKAMQGLLANGETCSSAKFDGKEMTIPEASVYIADALIEALGGGSMDNLNKGAGG